MSQIPTLLCFGFIGALFWLNYDKTVRTSKALWLPVIWLFIIGSRNVSEWMSLGTPLEEGGDRYLEGSPADRYALTALILFGALVLMTRSSRLVSALKLNYPIVCYLVYCGVSIAWSDYPQVGLKRWFRSLGDLIMVLIVWTDSNPVGAMKRVLSRVGFLVLPLSILFIRYYPEIGRAYGRWDGMVSWTGVTGGKNGLGMICLVYGLAAGWQFLVAWGSHGVQGRSRRMAAQGLVLLMAIYLLIISNSKTSLACFCLAATLMAAISLFKTFRRPTLINASVLGILAIPFFVLFLGFSSSALKSLGRDPTLTGRTDIWKIALQFTVDPIIGAGYETFWLGTRLLEISRLNNAGLNQAHNGYLEVYLNLGWVGICLLGMAIMSTYRRLVSGVKQNPEICGLLLAYFATTIIYNYTEGSFKMMTSIWMSFLFTTIAAPTLMKPINAANETVGKSRFLAEVTDLRRNESGEGALAGFRRDQRRLGKVQSALPRRSQLERC